MQIDSEFADLTLTNLINAYANSLNSNTNDIATVQSINNLQSVIIDDLEDQVLSLQTEIDVLQNQIDNQQIIVGCGEPVYGTGASSSAPGSGIENQLYINFCSGNGFSGEIYIWDLSIPSWIPITNQY